MTFETIDTSHSHAAGKEPDTSAPGSYMKRDKQPEIDPWGDILQDRAPQIGARAIGIPFDGTETFTPGSIQICTDISRRNLPA